ncbi:metallo-beta-lactamase family protein [Nitrobacter sp. Nb-311A]|uniref:MBL fold metallo-hydrolase n=1 Tax=Nitrobacter sp. Nb-311A TaxID=314253 RepID=UPI000068672E|nr:metallo-beta-lactamase family protein [Nitrobacter sp. Nb-311A]
MRVRIHLGTKEIGGTCIELMSDGARLLLDLGWPLDGDPDDLGAHSAIERLEGGGDLLGLVLSHGHVDHWGLAPLAGPDLPVALGSATLQILQAAAPFVPRPYVPARPVEFTSGTALQFGPFRVTPHLVDHSAYDAHAIEVEAGGKRLFYSGDIRGHGRKAGLFEKLVSHPPNDVDVMLMEGSSFGRLDPDLAFPTETEVEQRLVELFGEIKGLALVAAPEALTAAGKSRLRFLGKGPQFLGASFESRRVDAFRRDSRVDRVHPNDRGFLEYRVGQSVDERQQLLAMRSATQAES